MRFASPFERGRDRPILASLLKQENQVATRVAPGVQSVAIFVALLRAVNVGGTGKLPMGELRELCERLGFNRVRTYIASGNVVFEADDDEAGVQAALAAALHEHAGKPIGVMIRTAAQLEEILAANPYPECAPNLVHVAFLNQAPGADLLAGVSGRLAEQIAARAREVYVHYPQGQGASKMKLPILSAGTARNMNTVARLLELAKG